MCESQDLVLEHLKQIQAEQSFTKVHDEEILARLARIERELARVPKDKSSNCADKNQAV